MSTVFYQFVCIHFTDKHFNNRAEPAEFLDTVSLRTLFVLSGQQVDNAQEQLQRIFQNDYDLVAAETFVNNWANEFGLFTVGDGHAPPTRKLFYDMSHTGLDNTEDNVLRGLLQVMMQ